MTEEMSVMGKKWPVDTETKHISICSSSNYYLCCVELGQSIRQTAFIHHRIILRCQPRLARSWRKSSNITNWMSCQLEIVHFKTADNLWPNTVRREDKQWGINSICGDIKYWTPGGHSPVSSQSPGLQDMTEHHRNASVALEKKTKI